MEENRNEVVETSLVEQKSEKKAEARKLGTKIVNGVKKHWKGALVAVGTFVLGVAVGSRKGSDDDGDYYDEPVETTCEDAEEA